MTELPQSEHPREKLGDFMTTPVISIDVKATVQEAAYLMDTENASAILTTDNEKHVGIITERDFTRKVVGRAPVIHSRIRGHEPTSLYLGPQ